jgi:acyl carrier protein
MPQHPGLPAPQVGTTTAGATLDIIQTTWAEILGVERVAPDDDFFDLGGNSLIVASAVARLGPRLGIELAPRALFEAPTPAEMAELVAERRAAQPALPADGVTPFFPDWVIPLQPEGTARPVFLVPGGLGGYWILKRDAQVAALVGQQHPFYGFRRDRPHLDPNRPDWIAAMAAEYIAQMRTLQGRGPFLIYGVCSGGALAWEMARQLLAAGEVIAGMLFYESPLRPDLAGVTPHHVPRLDLPGLVPPYVPEPLPVDLTLLMTEAWRAEGRSDGWPPVVRGHVETIVMPGKTPGAHNLYIHREAMIAGHLRDWIARAEARLHGG